MLVAGLVVAAAPGGQQPRAADQAPTAAGQAPPATAPTRSAQPVPPEQEALKKLIEEQIRQRSAATRPAAAGAPPTAAGPATQPATTQPTSLCHGQINPQFDLNPPPEDQPQPRWACESLTVKAEPVWQGQSAEFTFRVGNEGQAPLNLRLQGQ